MNKVNITSTHILAVILFIAAIYIIYSGNNLKTSKDTIESLKKDKIELQDELAKSNAKLDSLKERIDISNKAYMSLYISKNKTQTLYEIRIKEVSNSSIISNDSITKYIASKIHN